MDDKILLLGLFNMLLVIYGLAVVVNEKHGGNSKDANDDDSE